MSVILNRINSSGLIIAVFISLFSLSIQANDCTSANAIVCNDVISASTVGETPIGTGQGTCVTGDGAGGTQWYTFIGDGGDYTFEITAGTYDTKLWVFSGSCGSLTCVTGDDDGGSGTLSRVNFTASLGVVYYVVVGGFSGAEGSFSISASCIIPVLPSTAPGGVLSLKTWFRAEDYTPASTSWINNFANPNVLALNTDGSTPIKNVGNANYNPSLTFNETDDSDDFYINNIASSDVVSINSGTMILTMTSPIPGSTNRHAVGLVRVHDGDEFTLCPDGVWHQTNTSGTWATYTNIASPTIFQSHISEFSTAVNPDLSYLHGTTNSSDNYSSVAFDNVSTMDFSIGDVLTSAPGADFGGDIAEEMTFSTVLTPLEKIKVESYLAIKYGETLSASGPYGGDYLNTGGDVVWDASTSPAYHNDVIGLGRDDVEELAQKQSHTADDLARMYISSLNVSNQSNTGSISSDVSYVMMGNNQGQVCATASSNLEVPTACGLYSRLEREWKITKTNFSQNFNLDLTIATCALPLSVNTSHLRLLVDDDGDFSSGATCYYNGDGSGIVISYSGSTITVSNISNTHIADFNTRYITIGSIDAATPLPVGLIDFKAENIDNRYVELNWQTTTEVDNDYFTVFKSQDGDSWEEVLTQPGAGNSSALLSYSGDDYYPLNGMSYYQLRQTDYDGVNSFSNIRVVNFSQQSSGVSVQPNPTTGKVLIRNVKCNISQCQLLNSLGQNITNRSVLYASGQNEWVIDLSDFTNGVYLFRTENEVIRIIKN